MLIVVDAMGVLFRTHDDWPGCLSRFVAAHGGERASREREQFVDLYLQCTKGLVTTTEFWEWCGLDPVGLDEQYIASYATTAGLQTFLANVGRAGHQVACLTNDSATWSGMLRSANRLSRIEPWVVSSDLGIRKPDERAFRAVESATGKPLVGALFVDDTAANLDAAAALGMQALHYRGEREPGTHQLVASWSDVSRAIQALTEEDPEAAS